MSATRIAVRGNRIAADQSGLQRIRAQHAGTAISFPSTDFVAVWRLASFHPSGELLIELLPAGQRHLSRWVSRSVGEGMAHAWNEVETIERLDSFEASHLGRQRARSS